MRIFAFGQQKKTDKKMFKKDIQYLVTYSIQGTSFGTQYLIALDFPMSKVCSNANDTAFNILQAIWEKHNESYEPKLPRAEGIGIVSMTRIN